MASTLRLVQVQVNGETCPRVCAYLGKDESVADITTLDSSIPRDMKTFLENGETAMTAAARCVLFGKVGVATSSLHASIICCSFLESFASYTFSFTEQWRKLKQKA